MERAVEDAPDDLRKARWWAIAAFLLLVTSVWLPWWLLRYSTPSMGIYSSDGVWLFLAEQPETTRWGPVLTGILVAITALWLFVRVAGRSWLYEPKAWQRDLALQAGLILAALVSTAWWPDDVPSFWGGRTFRLGTNGTETFTETTMPGLGWWCAAAAWVCLLVAFLLGRRDAGLADDGPGDKTPPAFGVPDTPAAIETPRQAASARHREAPVDMPSRGPANR